MRRRAGSVSISDLSFTPRLQPGDAQLLIKTQTVSTVYSFVPVPEVA